ncbi:MAG: VWA domain-containing protein [Bacteroidales bacterium]|nr:VWA domain-containing protein [Bacteroidales bacterium]
MTFANPKLLFLLLLVPAAIAWYLIKYRKQKPELHFSNISFFSGKVKKTLRQRLRPLVFVLRVIALTAAIIALARPQTKLSRQEMKVEGIDVMLTIDVSGSMLAEDFKPNRLKAAKKVARNFIEGRKTDRMGLVIFAGEAFTQTPLTIDHNVLLGQLDKIEFGTVEDGTALGDGLATAINRIKDSKAVSKVIILLTDGVNNRGSVDPESAAEIAALYGIRLYIIGVGTRGEAPYPFKVQTPFGTHTQYQNIPVEIDEPMMKAMAEQTDGGKYFRATNNKSLQAIFDEIDQMEKTKIDVTQYNQTKDEYLPFLIIALVAFALEILLGLTYFKTTP